MTAPSPIEGGVMAAALTPLNNDLSPNHDAWLAHSRNLLDQGCSGLAVLGTTMLVHTELEGNRLCRAPL